MKQFLLLLLMVSSTIISAQPNSNSDIKNGSVSGRVIDAQLNEPLPYVNIVIKDMANKIITGGITNDDGTFEIQNIPEGKVIVSIQFVGFKTVDKNVTIGKGNYNPNLGDINLEEESTGLDEVTVVADVSTIQQRVDRKVITIGKDLQTAGATASEIMNNLPSVSVDQQSGSISLRGNQNVRVMVDGKISNIPAEQLLKQIPSTSIKSIELITNPSAKYNPEGMSGIINIVLHKNTQLGFNGNINVGLAYDIEPKFNSSIDANYRNGKLNFYGSYGNNIRKNANDGGFTRVDQQIQQNFDILNNNKSHLFKVGLDYYLDDKNRLFLHAGFTSMHGVEKEIFKENFYFDRTLWEMALSMDTKIKKDAVTYPKRLLHYKEIFIGHTPTLNFNEDKPMNVANIWNIDTGAAFTGKICAMNIDTKEYVQSDKLPDLYPNEKGRNK